MARIELQSWPTALENHGETLLETLLAHEVPFPFSCSSGDCGACKARLSAGEVKHQSCSSAILSDEERSQGYVLACRCTPQGDVRIEPLEPLVALPPAQRQRAWVGAQSHRERGFVVLHLLPQRPVAFLPGQYFNLKFDNLPARAYSVASVPGSETLEFHIREVHDGKASVHAQRRDLPGSVVEIDGPHGHGYWREQHTGPLVAVGGGTGLAPMVSIVRAALARDPQREVHLYYAAREHSEVYWDAELRALCHTHPGLRVRYALSRLSASEPRPDDTSPIAIHHERVTETLRREWPRLDQAKVYVAGSPALVGAITHLARAHGALAQDVHADAFSPATNHRLDHPMRAWIQRQRLRWSRPPTAVRHLLQQAQEA